MSDEVSEREEMRKRRIQAVHEAHVSQRLKDTGRERTRIKPDSQGFKSLRASPASRKCPHPHCGKLIKEPLKRATRTCPHCGDITPF